MVEEAKNQLYIKYYLSKLGTKVKIQTNLIDSKFNFIRGQNQFKKWIMAFLKCKKTKELWNCVAVSENKDNMEL